MNVLSVALIVVWCLSDPGIYAEDPFLVLQSDEIHAGGIINNHLSAARSIDLKSDEERALAGIFGRLYFETNITGSKDRKQIVRAAKFLADRYSPNSQTPSPQSLDRFAHIPPILLGLVEPIQLVEVMEAWTGRTRFQFQGAEGTILIVYTPYGVVKKVGRPSN